MLKAKSSRNSGELLARKGLVILQFSLSIAFIIAVMVVYEQIQLVKTKNMGFNREQVIQFGREGNLGKGLETFLAALSQIPGVVHASGISGGFLDVNSFTVGVEWPGKQANPLKRKGAALFKINTLRLCASKVYLRREYLGRYLPILKTKKSLTDLRQEAPKTINSRIVSLNW